jgi:CubicO group peptidase (beta-lactamase class C family)
LSCEIRLLAAANCMRAHGVADLQDPVDRRITLTPGTGIDPDSPTFQAASQAGASLGPSAPARSAAGSWDPAGNPLSAATWRSFGAWLAQRSAAGEFSGAVLVARDRELRLDAAYGLADRRDKIPNTPRTKCCIASIGKLLTAVAIARLAEAHELGFNDTIGRYLRGFNTAGADHVTIAELLTMTSGLDNVVLSRPNPPTAIAGMVKLITKERPQCNPGSRFLNSNDGYILLGAILQKVTARATAPTCARASSSPPP